MKYKTCYIFTLLFIFSFGLLPITTSIPAFAITTTSAAVNATTTHEKNIDLVILFNDNSIDKNIENIVTNSGGKIVKEFSDLGGIEVKCPSKLISTIKSKDSVQSLAPNHVIKLSNEKTESFTKLSDNSTSISNDLYSQYQWDIKRVTNNGKTFDLESGNHNVIVGIIDSGIDKTHPDLANNFLGGKNLVPSDFEDDSSETGNITDVKDRLGHGTNVAGVIAANGRTKGVAPNIGFKSYRVFNKDGETNAAICSSAIITAVNDGVKVINLSIGNYDLKGKCYWTDPDTGITENLGDDMAEYSLIKRAIKYAVKKGVTVVAAAGNESLDCSNEKTLTNYLNKEYKNDGYKYVGLTYELPGDVKNVITVSATDKNDKLASYSNYGKKYIDISAPGGDMAKTYNTEDMCLTTDINSSYTWTEGTSFSAPKVSAVAALIICRNNDSTPKKIANKIYKTADKLENGKLGKYYGAGMVNAYNAIQ